MLLAEIAVILLSASVEKERATFYIPAGKWPSYKIIIVFRSDSQSERKARKNDCHRPDSGCMSSAEEAAKCKNQSNTKRRGGNTFTINEGLKKIPTEVFWFCNYLFQMIISSASPSSVSSVFSKSITNKREHKLKKQ